MRHVGRDEYYTNGDDPRQDRQRIFDPVQYISDYARNVLLTSGTSSGQSMCPRRRGGGGTG